MVEACSTWTIELEERGKKDMYAKISPIWPCDIYSIQCSEGRKKEIVRDLICVCPKNPELITSKIFCVIYNDKFVCSNFDKITLYFFDTKKWALKSSKASLMREILTGMYRFIADVCESYMETIEPGDNGKTVMVSLVERAFGDHAVKMPISLLMGKRVQSSAATPELAMLKGGLIALVQEPGEGDKLNLGVMKELTGNDSLYIRGLYEEGTIIPQTAKFVLIANRIPQMSTFDKAVWSRVRVMPFVSTFVDRIEPFHNPLITHLKDINFSNKIPLLAPVFMRLVIEEYKQYLTYGLEEPNEVKDCTETIRVSNDIFGQFLSANVEKSNKSIVAIKELYDI
uniref:SF3 helicase domain-containing protein n=1 Tax=Physcomitrium patens TaxID=3218 RepID=A0A2K1L211_PHYPA|nr:hypothetical protein PHYPA_002849 [Physcomitrium patens]